MTDDNQRIARADSRNRVSLGAAVEPGSWYSITIEDDGVVILTPVVIAKVPRQLARAA